MTLAIHVETLFGLASMVQKESWTKSGFIPLPAISGVGIFADLRIEGFAAALRTGFADELVLVGGPESAYPDEQPPIHRARAMREILIQDCDIAPERVSVIDSAPNTFGNVYAIRSQILARGIPSDKCGVMSNFYHLPRTHADMASLELDIRLVPAESLWLVEDPERKRYLVPRLGGGLMAARMAEEIAGIADKVRGTYESKKV